MPIFKFSLIALCLLTFSILIGQEKGVHYSLGYGSTSYNQKQVVLFTNAGNLYPSYSFSVLYMYRPKNSIVEYSTGISFVQRNDNSNNSIIRVPLNVDFSFGDNVKGVISPGLYSSFLIVSNKNENSGSNFNHTGVQLGASIGIHLEVPVFSNLRFRFGLLNQYDISNYLQINDRSGGRIEFSEKYKGYDVYLQFGIIQKL